jgi:hypothetical protein
MSESACAIAFADTFGLPKWTAAAAARDVQSLRVRGQGLVLLNRTREVIEALAVATAPAAEPSEP